MANIFDLFKSISTKKDAPSGIEYIIAGLGNPGAKYENTRHNAGFVALDLLADKLNVKINTAKFDALVTDAVISGKRVLLMKPQTFMNLSGNAVHAAAAFYKIPPERIIVVCDDVSFDPGFLRIRRKGSAGGHNGLKDIIAKLGTEDFIRIKLGVGKKPAPDYDMADWVLGNLPKRDAEQLRIAADNADSAIDDIIGGNIDGAMNKYSK